MKARSERPACRKCGRPLARKVRRKLDAAPCAERPFGVALLITRVGFLGWGHGARGWFCTARCGFQWACDLLDEAEPDARPR